MVQIDSITARYDDAHARSGRWWESLEFFVTLFWALVLSATIAWGATVANLTLTGTVPLILDIEVAPTAAAANLDLTANQTDLKVADVTVTTNNAAGYGVDVRSNNVSNGDCAVPCFYSATADESLSYTFSRNGTTIGFSGDTGTFVQTGAPSAAGGDLYAAEVTYDGTATLLSAASDYGEVLTFTVSVN